MQDGPVTPGELSEPRIDHDHTVTLGGLFGAMKSALPYLGGAVVFLAIPTMLGDRLGMDDASVLWIAGGLYVAIATLIRPWWFWNHRTSILLRVFLGDRGATVVYLCVAVAAIGAGAWRQSAITSARQECRVAIAGAGDVHERIRLLYQTGATNLPQVSHEPRDITCQRLLESK